MLNILKAIFGDKTKKERYPEAVVREAIERVVEKTDPWFRAVFDYKYRLRQAVILSLDHVENLISRLPPPLPIEFGPNLECPSLAAFFDSHADMLNAFRKDRKLADFLRDLDQNSTQVTALMMMEKSEKTIFTAELSGNIVARDVPQTSVSFLNQRFLEPAESENEVRHRLKNRAFDHLLKIAHKRLNRAKADRKELERWQTLFQSKLALLKREDGSPDESGFTGTTNAADILGQLKQIEAKLKEQGGEDKLLSVYLDIARDVLSHPEQHLWETEQHMILDHSGIKRAQPTVNGSEFTLQELCNSEGQQWAMLLITLSVDDLRAICG